VGSEAFETKLPGLVIFEPAVFGDERSFSMRIRNRRPYEEVVMLSDYLQNKLAYSRCAVFRGCSSKTATRRAGSCPCHSARSSTWR
jgi:dTDP-4-dehydrorhamnose 3,5-epimerase-like enzyme